MARTKEIDGVVRLGLILVVASLPALIDHGAIAQFAALYRFAESAHPYWVPSHALVLYVRAPVTTLSACLLFLAPGLLLAIAAGMGRTIAEWVLGGFMLSVVGVSVVAGLVQCISGVPLINGAFAATVAVCMVPGMLLLWYRVRSGWHAPQPWTAEGAGTTVAAMVVTSFLLLISLAPKFYWESFNGDGAHTFEATRLLLRQPAPFFDPRAGAVSLFPGMTTMLYMYPASWFMRLFGEVEASVRIPFVLYLSVLFCAIVTIAEQGRRPLSRAARWFVCMGLVVYAITMAYSATYSPYSADIALPATQDTLLMVMFLAFTFFFVEKRPWWMTLAILLTYLSLPSGLMLILLWLVAVVFWRPRPWRTVIQSLIALLGCIVAGALVSRLLPILGQPAPGGEYGVASLLRYFAFLQLTDWHRVVYAALPCGVIPALALFAWKRHDAFGKALAAVAIGYFALFFIQANIALHHFVPAMILPLAVFWRVFADVGGNYRRVLMGAVAVGGVVALWLSLPRNAGPQVVSRRVGFAVEDRTAGYDRSGAESFRRAELLAMLFPRGWEAKVPQRSFSGSPLIWLYYAHHAPISDRSTNYVLQRLTDPAPAQMHLVAKNADAALYVLSDSVLALHRALHPPTPAGAGVYEVPRATLFRSEARVDEAHVIDMVNVLGAFGVDTAVLLRRLGVKR